MYDIRHTWGRKTSILQTYTRYAYHVSTFYCLSMSKLSGVYCRHICAFAIQGLLTFVNIDRKRYLKRLFLIAIALELALVTMSNVLTFLPVCHVVLTVMGFCIKLPRYSYCKLTAV